MYYSTLIKLRPHRYRSLPSQVFHSFRNRKGKRVFYQPWVYIPCCHWQRADYVKELVAQ